MSAVKYYCQNRRGPLCRPRAQAQNSHVQETMVLIIYYLYQDGWMLWLMRYCFMSSLPAEETAAVIRFEVSDQLHHHWISTMHVYGIMCHVPCAMCHVPCAMSHVPCAMYYSTTHIIDHHDVLVGMPHPEHRIVSIATGHNLLCKVKRLGLVAHHLTCVYRINDAP